MMENIDLSLVDWSRGQFALTAMYHWLFVPLTLGLSFIIAFMETLYVRTGKAEWKRATKFWMTLFGINFAIGVATGLILEFEFGTNWSNYSWFVGDIFGAPLAVEGIMAFFMESTFIAVMFFGWNKVSKKFHLTSTWLVAIGANLSALWILVANAWMQNPVGMQFNPETARNEMMSFWEVLFNPMAIETFLHTISSGFVLASAFVIGVSAWFLLKKREQLMARKSILIAGSFGLLASLYIVVTGDTSARTLAEAQPVKLAAMEGLYDGTNEAGLVVVGVLAERDKALGKEGEDAFRFRMEIPNLLSFMTYGESDAYVEGINDHVYGNADRGILSGEEKIRRGKIARQALADMQNAKAEGRIKDYEGFKARFYEEQFKEDYFRYFGYGFLNAPEDMLPNVPMTFYSFHIMVGLGFYLIVFFIFSLLFLMNHSIDRRRFFLRLAIFTIPIPYIASMAGWIVTEMGRQPWVIQDIMPTVAAVSQLDASSVQLTFWLFALIFTALLIAEIKIMTRQIKIGPKS
jgi:cytochrome d ubiquinol oxidase subunit I